MKEEVSTASSELLPSQEGHPFLEMVITSSIISFIVTLVFCLFLVGRSEGEKNENLDLIHKLNERVTSIENSINKIDRSSERFIADEFEIKLRHDINQIGKNI